MSVYLMPNAGGGQSVSNYERPVPASGPFAFYEAVYSTPGPQEWVFLPGFAKAKVCISFPAQGSAFLEGTVSPPNDAERRADAVLASAAAVFSPAVYPLTDHVVDTTVLTIEGDTAVRVNVLGGSKVVLSIRV